MFDQKLGLGSFSRTLDSHEDDALVVGIHKKKLSNKRIISRILYFSIHLSRILVAQDLEQGIPRKTAPKT